MDRDRLIRTALRASALFNVGGALLFAFPDSVGRLAGVPPGAPAPYVVLVTGFVLLFGGAYAWAASRPAVDRTVVGLGAIGKSGAFVSIFGCWLAGAAPFVSVVAMGGDLAFAAVFAWWLVTDPAASG